jgi:large subunit ribosomal protein L9
MKVILLRDVARLGKRFAVVDVPDGFALNKLIPQGLAQPATGENLKRVQARAKEVELHAAHDSEALTSSLKALADTPLQLRATANAEGGLFKAIKAADISEAARALGYHLPVGVIMVTEPLKSVGQHTIDIKAGDTHGHITITIMAQ